MLNISKDKERRMEIDFPVLSFLPESIELIRIAGRSPGLFLLWRLPVRIGTNSGLCQNNNGTYSSGNCSGLTPDSLLIPRY
jgi:hypothetical protein